MKTNHSISIIICTYNRAEVLSKSLKSLGLQNDLDFELVLVNNHSTDNTDYIISDFIADNPTLNIRYFIEKNQGLSYARNRGIREASGEILIFLDDDAFALPNYVEAMKVFFLAHPHVEAGGGKILPHWQSSRPRWMSKYLLSLVSVLDKGNKVQQFHGREYPIGANMFIHKKLFEKFGAFNISLGRKGKNMEGAEEKDFFLRIKKVNTPIYYVPSAIVEHWVPDSRLTDDFFSAQANAIGQSEKTRSLQISKTEYFFSCCRELFKWAATVILFIAYTLCGQYAKGAKLVEFRRKVSRGLLE